MSEQHRATCETNGHIFGHEGVCVFCRAPKPTPEPSVTTDPLAAIRERWAGATDVPLTAIRYEHGGGRRADVAQNIRDNQARTVDANPAPMQKAQTDETRGDE